MPALLFLPALGAPLWKSCIREQIADCIARRGPAYHPHALLSFFHWQRTRVPPAWRDHGFIFGDSGGFSIRTKAAEIHPVEALEWQASNCTAGCLLDVPPIDSLGRPCWERALRQTAAHTRAALPPYEKLREANNPFRWWGVVHGQPGCQVAEWWNTIARLYPFSDQGEGWAFRPEPTVNPVTVAYTLGFIRQHGVRRAHFFWCTGWAAVATLAVLAREAGLESASFDSASAAKAAANRVMMIRAGDGLRWSLLREQSQWGDTHDDRWRVREYMWGECECASCRELRAGEKTIEGVSDGVWGIRVYLHNLLVMVETFRAYAAGAACDGQALLRTTLTRRDYHLVQMAVERAG